MTAPNETGRGPYLGLSEAAEYLDVSTRTLRNYVARGNVPAHRMIGSRLLRFRAADLDNMLRPVTSGEAS